MIEFLLLNQNNPLLTYNLIAFCLGVMVHVGKKLIENHISLKDYLLNHGGRTTLSITSLISTFTYISMSFPDASILVYFLAAYTLDSFINKAPIGDTKITEVLQSKK